MQLTIEVASLGYLLDFSSRAAQSGSKDGLDKNPVPLNRL